MKKSTTHGAAGTSARRRHETTCAQPVHNHDIGKVHRDIDGLFAACSPETMVQVRRYLDMTDGPEAALINEWRRYGAHDVGRTVALGLSETAKRTVTPLGFACLIGYARAWLDAVELRAAELKD